MDPTTKPETGESAAAAGALVRVAGAPLPPVLARAGPRARFAAEEFFAAQLRNPHTRRAYRRWIGRFIAACDAAGVELAAVTPGFAGRWIDELPVGPLSKNQALTALRRFCDGLVMRHVIALNPFLSVRFQKYQAVEGRTPEITRGRSSSSSGPSTRRRSAGSGTGPSWARSPTRGRAWAPSPGSSSRTAE